MKEIKFKVWNKEKQEMYFTDISDNITSSNSIMECRIGLDAMGWYVAIRGFNEEEFTEINNFELIQYTGLKDINGVEIYEGDIQENNTGKSIIKIGKTTFNTYGSNDHYECLCVYEEFINGETQILTKNNIGKVIGNIYENLELLTEG